MPIPDDSGLNVGELIRGGLALRTREVLALAHEVCRHAGAEFPQSPDDLWITETGELLVTRSDRMAPDVAPRAGVATLLETMLPDGDQLGDCAVPTSLRGLPARLRASEAGVGPRDRRDLMSILSWHLGADPREQLQRLAHRATRQDAAAAPAVAAAAAPPVAAAAAADLDLFPELSATTPAAAPALPPRKRKRVRASSVLALLAMGFLFIAIGSASFWFFRARGPDEAVSSISEAPVPPAAPVAAVEPPEAAPDSGPVPLQLGVPDGAFSPAFADARTLFFHAGHTNAGRLLIANLDDRGAVSRVSAVFDERARNYHPRVSPDGRLMAFDSDRDGERGVYVSDRDGSNPQRVSGSGYAAVPSWSPDMKWLAFVRGEPNRPNVWNLWLRDLASGATERHTSFRSGQVWGASWFPDGRSFAYSHEDRMVMSHLDARADIVIDSPRRGQLLRTPAVSPDGQHVVFQVFKDGVWLFDVKTGAMRRILDDPTAEEFSWTPNGRRIAYHSRRDGAWKIWVMPVPVS